MLTRMTNFGAPTFHPVGTLSLPTGVLGIIDPCLIDSTNPYAQPENYGARIALGFGDWDAHYRLDGHEVAELRLVPSGTPADRVRIDWDGTIADLRNRDLDMRRIGEVGVDSGTIIALDPSLAEGLDYATHVTAMVEDAAAWAVPTDAIASGAIVSSSGCGDGAYDIHLVVTTKQHTLGAGHAVAVIVNFGLDDEISRCSDCGEEDGHCRCEACTGCGNYYPSDDLREGKCDDCLDIDEDDLD